MKVQTTGRISRHLTTTTHAAKAKKAAEPYEQPAVASPTGVGTDRLEVSDQTRTHQTATVERLKAQIKAGTYHD
jgi:anti-sigma28 factor (negative regulator of flagellin synthesis)